MTGNIYNTAENAGEEPVCWAEGWQRDVPFIQADLIGFLGDV